MRLLTLFHYWHCSISSQERVDLRTPPLKQRVCAAAALLVRSWNVPTYRVIFRLPDGTEHDVAVSEEEHLLDAALEAGLALPYHCLQGWCLTCAARLVSGDVDQRDSRRYFAEDRAAGFVLPCTGRAQSDVVLETHARRAMRRNRERHHLPFPRGDWGTSGR